MPYHSQRRKHQGGSSRFGRSSRLKMANLNSFNAIVLKFISLKSLMRKGNLPNLVYYYYSSPRKFTTILAQNSPLFLVKNNFTQDCFVVCSLFVEVKHHPIVIIVILNVAQIHWLTPRYTEISVSLTFTDIANWKWHP